MRERTLAMALGILGSFCSLIALGCAGTVALPPDKHRAEGEREIFVELPGQTKLTDDELKRSYLYRGGRTIGHVRARCLPPHQSGTPCRNATTDVRITAVEGAKYISADKHPDRPQLLGWIENLGDRPTFDGIRPVTEAIYALVVDSKDTVGPAFPRVPRPIIRRVEFPSVERARSGQRPQVTLYGVATHCHDYAQPYISAADYQVCDEYKYTKVGRVPVMGSRVHALLTTLVSWVSLTASDDPTWFSCSSGCCTSANPS